MFGRFYIDGLNNPRAINDRFEITGRQDLSPSPNTAYVWNPLHGFTYTQGPDGQEFFPWDLNNQGDVVGTKASGENEYGPLGA